MPNIFQKWLYRFLLPTAVNDSFCCSTSLSVFSVLSGLDFGHSSSCVLLSHFYFTFPNDIWGWMIFHVLIFHSYIFIGEVSNEIFCLFLNWFVCFLIVQFWVLCVFQIQVHFWMYVLQTFFPKLWLYFYFLQSSFGWVDSFLILKKSKLSLFFIYGSCFFYST